MAVNPKTPLPHPRLHFWAGDLPKLREKAQTTHALFWERLVRCVDRYAAWGPVSNKPDSYFFAGGSELYLEEAGAVVTAAALAFVVGQEQRHLEQVRRIVAGMSQVPQKELTNYGFGAYAMGLSRAYDWCYEYLTEDERQNARTCIAKISRLLYEQSFPKSEKRAWWAACHLHHDHWIPTAGYGVGGLVLAGEIDEANAWAARAREEFRIAFSLLGNDGAWHEGTAPWCYALAPLFMFLEPLGRATGENVYDQPWLKNTGRFRLYSRLPDGTYISNNDSFRTGRYNALGSASSHLLRKLASLYGDGYCQWLAEADEKFDLSEKSPGQTQDASLHCAPWNFLWHNPAVAAKAPNDLPPDLHCENLGVAILRSGWDKGSSVTTLSCGPLCGHRFAEDLRAGSKASPSNWYHTQADYNSFTLFAGDTYLIVPPGYGRRDPRWHNTVLVDGMGMRYAADNKPAILQFESCKSYAYALGDATDAFLPDLQVTRFHRHLVFIRPDCWVIHDDIRTSPERWHDIPARKEWLAHIDPATCRLDVEGNRFGVCPNEMGKAVLYGQIFQRENFLIEKSEILDAFGHSILTRLIAGTCRETLPEWRNLVVMAAAKPDGAPRAAEALQSKFIQGVVVRSSGMDRVVAFCTADYLRNNSISYDYTPAAPLSEHLVLGLPPETDFGVRVTPVSAQGSTFGPCPLHIEITVGGSHYRSSAAGTLGFQS